MTSTPIGCSGSSRNSATRGELALPRFEFETSVELKDALSALGMPEAFEPGADFGAMVAGGGDGPWIDEMYHEAFVSVDEEGTEAAAFTAVVMVDSAPPDRSELRFDRPFLFCIRDRPTDAVLFLVGSRTRAARRATRRGVAGGS